jgi:hypothetical protein
MGSYFATHVYYNIYDQDVAENSNSSTASDSSDSNSINIKEEPGGDLSKNNLKSGDCEA